MRTRAEPDRAPPDAWDTLATVAADVIPSDDKASPPVLGLALVDAGRLDLARAFMIAPEACATSWGPTREYDWPCANAVMLHAALGECETALAAARSWNYGHDIHRPSTVLQAAGGVVLQHCHEGEWRVAADGLANQIVAQVLGGRPLSFAVPALEDGFVALERIDDAAQLAEIGGRSRAVDLLLTVSANTRASCVLDAAQHWRALALALADQPLEQIHHPSAEALRLAMVANRHDERELISAQLERARRLAPTPGDVPYLDLMLRLANGEQPNVVLGSHDSGLAVELTLTYAELAMLAGGSADDCAFVVSTLLDSRSFSDSTRERPPLRGADRLPRPLPGLELVVTRALADVRGSKLVGGDWFAFASFVARYGHPEWAAPLVDVAFERSHQSDADERVAAAVLIEAGAIDRVLAMIEAADPPDWEKHEWLTDVLISLTTAVMRSGEPELEAELIRVLQQFAR